MRQKAGSGNLREKKGHKKPPTKKQSSSEKGGAQKRKNVDMMNISEFEDTEVHEGNNYQEQAFTSKKRKKANRVNQKKKKVTVDSSDKPVVQIRQKISHERNLFFFEQLMLKHQITRKFPHLHFEKVAHGFDIYYKPNAYAELNEEMQKEGGENQSQEEGSNVIKFIKLINNLMPIRDLENKSVMTGAFQKGKLGGGIGSIGGSSSLEGPTTDHNEQYFIEIAPICVGDLVCLPQRLFNSSGQIGPLVICYKVTNSLFFIDPYTLKNFEVTAQSYFQSPFRALLSVTQLAEYTINDIEVKKNQKGRPISAQAGRFQLSEVSLVKTSELGVAPDVQTFCHITQLLEVGDTVYGYDLKNANINNDDLTSYKKLVLPDVIIVKKKYEWETQRIWKLNHFCMEPEGSDYDAFLNDLEEDQDMRSKVMLFKHENSGSIASKIKFDSDGKNPRVRLEELLEAWTI